MMLEKEIEQKLIGNLSALSELSSSQIIGSRQFDKTEKDVQSVVAIASGFRINDQFTLPMINVPVTIAVTTRVEEDRDSESHEKVVEAIANKLSYWHKYPSQFENDLSCSTMKLGELFMNGGQDRVYDSEDMVWSESMQFSIRGSERFSI